ncbi:unnamed protein product [Arctia plantaginis]|uniref:Uncharacterized protein n=1 Tax=Arctia plantaginis TaxID=874455 RepID=A0A8S1AM71_ARCPL|nr:unnamed protein product [Arctia plantaginis]
MFRSITQRLSQRDDEFDVFGKNVAAKLRSMTTQQKMLAEKLINDVVFNGQMEQLSLDSKLTVRPEKENTNNNTERFNYNNMAINGPQYQYQVPVATHCQQLYLSAPECTESSILTSTALTNPQFSGTANLQQFVPDTSNTLQYVTPE